jgi:hypothetical protein
VAVCQDIAHRAVQHLSRIGGMFRSRLPQAGIHGRTVGPACGWLLAEAGQVIDDGVDHGIPEGAHLIRRELQGSPPSLVVNLCAWS